MISTFFTHEAYAIFEHLSEFIDPFMSYAHDIHHSQHYDNALSDAHCNSLADKVAILK